MCGKHNCKAMKQVAHSQCTYRYRPLIITPVFIVVLSRAPTKRQAVDATRDKVVEDPNLTFAYRK